MGLAWPNACVLSDPIGLGHRAVDKPRLNDKGEGGGREEDPEAKLPPRVPLFMLRIFGRNLPIYGPFSVSENFLFGSNLIQSHSLNRHC